MNLPPRIVTVRRDFFNEPEEDFYESLYTDSVRTFSTYIAANTVLNNYASIFSLLSRMRLAVNHPDLVSVKMALASNTAKENLVCGICNEEAECPILSKCKHVFCREDARLFLESAPEDGTITCPVCFKLFSIDLSQQEVENSKSSGVQTNIVNHIDLTKWRSSTKIEGKQNQYLIFSVSRGVEQTQKRKLHREINYILAIRFIFRFNSMVKIIISSSGDSLALVLMS